MKFVHLTSQPHITLVKRNGIRFGNGRRGRGVYAVPLMQIKQVSLSDNDRVILADSRSSTTLWKWLATLRHRHRHLAAVVFKTTAKHWPADLYLELNPKIGIDWLSSIGNQDAIVADSDLQFVCDAHRQGFLADLKLSIQNQAGLGTVLHAIQSCGFTTWEKYDESIEIIFPYPIPSNLIERITPLYRTNKQFKQKRQHQ